MYGTLPVFRSFSPAFAASLSMRRRSAGVGVRAVRTLPLPTHTMLVLSYWTPGMQLAAMIFGQVPVVGPAPLDDFVCGEVGVREAVTRPAWLVVDATWCDPQPAASNASTTAVAATAMPPCPPGL